ncbi:hypothetical protein [Bacillus sp. FJAT-49736]|uniref:hypothetical protein n=1 Tax=Bacillus sp. FJAT-49736 TaxID=2833582 RepID=UPI001BC934DB|nr:hypothetical protein [Bacillus sp. FJAT-49736]MBS4174293.1 hypothetical protein [Bacillus sp. FJAT-49736]
MFWVTLLVIIIAFVLVGWLKQRGKTAKQLDPISPTAIHATYSNSNSTYVADGTSDRFVIKKDDRFEFLIENGMIVACKDKSRHSDFIYYTEG